MVIVSPSGRTYQWDKETPPTEADMKALQEYDAQMGPSASKTTPSAAAPVQPPTAPTNPVKPQGNVAVAARPQTMGQRVNQFLANAMIPGGTGGPKPTAPTGNPLFISSPPQKVTNLAGDAGLEAVGASTGQTVGAATGLAAPAAVPLLGGAGATIGNAMAQRRQIAAGERKEMSVGEAVAAFIGGAIPGASLAKGGISAVAKAGAKNAASNVTAKAAETIVDEQRLPTPQELALAAGGAAVGTGLAKTIDKGLNAVAVAEAIKRAQDATRRETLAAGRELGYVLPPSVVQRNKLGAATINSLGGKAPTAQRAVELNQPITNQAMREEIGLPKADLSTGGTAAISVPELNAAKAGPFAVYDEIKKTSPQASIALQQYQDAASEERKLRSAYRKSPTHDRSLKEAADQFGKEADVAFAALENEVQAAGKADLIDRLKEARVKLAKIGLVEDARNLGTGDIDATIIGRALDAQEKLTGNLEKVGRFQNAFAQMVKDQANSPSSGVNQLPLLLGGTGAGYMAAVTGRPEYAAGALGAMVVGPHAARSLMLSKPYQSAFVNYSYGPSRQDFPAMVARMLPQVASRQVNPQAFQQPMPPAPTPFLNRP